MNSMSKSKASSSLERTTSDSPEESSWTMYFEDFFANENDDDHHHYHESSSFSSSEINYQSSSLVSDAASSVAKKFAIRLSNHVERAPDDHPLVKSCNRLTFKKRKTKGGLVDDDLEDTASSPANSPKVCNLAMSHFDKNQKQNDEMHVSSQEKGSTSDQNRRDETAEEVGFNGRDGDNKDLKKMGLCLVPLSVVMNYLG